jgi:starch synthase (maltosyl-transferring)
LHFNHIALPPIFASGSAADPFLAGETELASRQLGFGTTLEDAVEAISKPARSAGLRTIFDVVLDRVDRRGKIASSHPDLFVASFKDIADPRSDHSAREAAFARFGERDCAKELLRLWHLALDRILSAGAGGFRFINIQNVPPDFVGALLLELRASHPDLLALAWTPGVGWSHFRSLEGLGFDGVFSSLPWWDFRSPWLLEEYDVLRRIAPVLGLPEAPFAPRLNAKLQPSKRLLNYRRRLRFGAAAFDGLFVPIGVGGAAALPLSDSEHLEGRECDALLQSDIVAANAWQAGLTNFDTASEIRNMSEDDGAVTTLARFDRRDARLAQRAYAILINSSLHRAAKVVSLDPLPPYAGAPFEAVAATYNQEPSLAPGEVRVVELERSVLVHSRRANESQALKNGLRAPRLAIERVQPAIDQGRFAVKRLVGEAIEVTADVFSDGHGVLAADLLWKAVDEREWHRVPMTLGHNDVWRGSFRPARVGRHVFTVEGWLDPYATLCHAMAAKEKAGVDLAREREEALDALDRVLQKAEEPEKADLAAVRAAGDTATLLSAKTQSVMRMLGGRPFLHCHEPEIPVDVERPQAGIGAWYELFPRSASSTPGQHGTFIDVIARLPAIRAMGFDVLYFPPIHPIGIANRKGRNNALTAGPDDPGSCYAIGSSLGGHDAILPALGTFDDFIRLKDAAAEQGLELALDFAVQCSPDHPWLNQHPDWFRWEQDGSLRFAENPPKKYEDIVNLEFYADPPVGDLWRGLRDIVLFWVNQGIRIFRVDNPHTKPLPFWEWMIADVRVKHPDVIFLSEAFTRPKLMYRLAKLGFSQSYTYFTWRNTKHELIEYLTELSAEPVVDFFRPNFFVNTPDINPYYLQTSGRPGFVIRAVLAATLSSLWGMYSGFELCESTPLPGREEYLDSEKYEIKSRDYASPENIIDEIARLNRIRRSNPELQSRIGLTFCPAHNDQVLVYARGLPERRELILVAVTLDPFSPQDVTFELPFERLELATDSTVTVQDLLHDNRFFLTGALQRLRLDPNDMPFAIWRLSPIDGGGR